MNTNEIIIDVFHTAGWIVERHRPWFRYLRNRFNLHPIVEAAMEITRPQDWHQLLLEWPYVSVSDKTKLAYTRDERAGEQDRQTLTSPGKYLRRHFPDLSDHQIRDLVALHVAGPDTFRFLHTTDEMIEALQNGPQSCMRWEGSDADEHPYNAYAPCYGWHLAVRIESDGMVCGRALCMEDEHGEKFFVRSYKRERSGGYSHSDEALEAWLRNQGYEKHGGWEDCLLAWVPGRPFIAPYLDGGCQAVYEDSVDNVRCLRIVETDDSRAEWTCHHTDGEPREVERGDPCHDCDDPTPSDDGHWVGRSEERWVCESCRDYNYTRALSRRGRYFYVENDDVVEVCGEYYDANYLDDNGVVCDVDGEYQMQEDCVYIEDDGEWYPADDDRIVENEDGEWVLRTEEV